MKVPVNREKLISSFAITTAVLTILASTHSNAFSSSTSGSGGTPSASLSSSSSSTSSSTSSGGTPSASLSSSSSSTSSSTSSGGTLPAPSSSSSSLSSSSSSSSSAFTQKSIYDNHQNLTLGGLPYRGSGSGSRSWIWSTPIAIDKPDHITLDNEHNDPNTIKYHFTYQASTGSKVYIYYTYDSRTGSAIRASRVVGIGIHQTNPDNYLKSRKVSLEICDMWAKEVGEQLSK